MAQSDKVSAALDAYFKEWQEMEERMRAIVAPLLKQQEQIHKHLQPIVVSQKAFQKAIESILSEQERWKCIVHYIELPKISLPDLAPLTRQAEELQRSFRELPLRTQEALILLGKHGWYLDLEMSPPGLWELNKALTDGNVAEAEDALIEYFEGRTDEIEKSIVERFPKRQKLITAAFNAHRRQEYELSIPVLLAQTDGICKEVFNEYLFQKNNKKPRTAIYIEQMASDALMATLLSPLAQTLPIGESELERGKGFSGLNRHIILHGDSLDYGNKINSLKAISLINYVAHVLMTDDENP